MPKITKEQLDEMRRQQAEVMAQEALMGIGSDGRGAGQMVDPSMSQLARGAVQDVGNMGRNIMDMGQQAFQGAQQGIGEMGNAAMGQLGAAKSGMEGFMANAKPGWDEMTQRMQALGNQGMNSATEGFNALKQGAGSAIAQAEMKLIDAMEGQDYQQKRSNLIRFRLENGGDVTPEAIDARLNQMGIYKNMDKPGQAMRGLFD